MKFLILLALRAYFCLADSYQEPMEAFPAVADKWSGQEEIDTLGDLTVFRFLQIKL